MANPENWRASRTLTAAERSDWLRLIRSENVGPATFAAAMDRFGAAGLALDALPALARRGGRTRGLRLGTVEDAEAELAAIDRHGARLLCLPEPDYPPLLRALDPAPPVLCAHGETVLFTRPALAIVGARNASANGRRFASDLARSLGEEGFAVVSGLARGIDAAAHLGALDTGTIAVLAGGIDHIYPLENADLFAEVAARGCLVSEMPFGFAPQARHFPRRNRLVSGLAHGVAVVEAALRSGSLITARFALEQGREVFAVPGSPLDPRARGCNRLIRDGAILTESAADVIDVLAPQLERRIKRLAEPSAPIAMPMAQDSPDGVHGHLLSLLGPAPVGLDELIRQSGLTAPVVAAALLELELAGRIGRLPGQMVALVSAPP